MVPVDYCPNCGCYHEIYGKCNSNQTEPDVKFLEPDLEYELLQQQEDLFGDL